MGKRDKSQNVIRGGSDLERKGANRVDLVAVSYGPRERRDKLWVVAAPPPPDPHATPLLLLPFPSPLACGKKGTSKFVGLPNVAAGLIRKHRRW